MEKEQWWTLTEFLEVQRGGVGGELAHGAPKWLVGDQELSAGRGMVRRNVDIMPEGATTFLSGRNLLRAPGLYSVDPCSPSTDDDATIATRFGIVPDRHGPR
jgi:hypothetical protein